MTNEELRMRVRELKVYKYIKYKDIATKINLTSQSFYSWMNHQYDFGKEKIEVLSIIIKELNENDEHKNL